MVRVCKRPKTTGLKQKTSTQTTATRVSTYSVPGIIYKTAIAVKKKTRIVLLTIKDCLRLNISPRRLYYPLKELYQT